MQRDYARAVAKGITVEALVRVIVQGAGKRWQATLRFPEGGGIATAYLPVLAAKRWLERRFEHVGLVTPIDAFTPETLFRDMAELGWHLDLEEGAQDSG